MIKKEKKIFAEADGELKYLTGDEELKRIEELRMKAELDEKSAYLGGVQEGKEEGIKNEKIEIAKKMKEEKLQIELIVKMTGLTKEEIEKL